MLRILVAALLVANLAFFLWTLGWLDSIVGARAIGDREPERLGRQVHPERVRILPLDAASAASAASSEPAVAASSGSFASASPPTPTSVSASASQPAATTCLEAGPLTDPEFDRAQAIAHLALADAALTDRRVVKPGRWMVYMGRYADHDALAKKEEELKRRKLQYEEILTVAALSPGLSLGRFDDRGAAGRALDQFAQQNIHTARVIELVPATTAHMLHLETTDPELATRAAALKLSASGGKGFAICAKP